MTVTVYVFGGFLGAGKTTLMGRVARQLVDRGSRVAVVVNDQSASLVDAKAMAAEGVPVAEVSGACFCCSFDDLIDRLRGLTCAAFPDVILAEPVGSCTDLAATVLQPLRRYFADEFRVLPLAVLVDPNRALRILTDTPKGGFSPKAAYIYKKQLEEADAIVLNKIDRLDPQTRSNLRMILTERFAHAPLFEISARTGEGVDELLDWLQAHPAQAGQRITEVDYDIYAAGEAELGWLNAVCRVTRDQGPIPLDELVMQTCASLADVVAGIPGGEVAHLKVLALGGGHVAAANCTSLAEGPALSRASAADAASAEVVVNLRAFADPGELSAGWEQTCSKLQQSGYAVKPLACRTLRPARPVPVYRFELPA